MTNFLAKVVKKLNVLTLLAAAILMISIAVGTICGVSGFGVFHKDALLENSNTLTVSMEQFVFDSEDLLKEVEETCETALKGVSISYEMKGDMSGNSCELVYLFNEGVDLTDAKAALETALDDLEGTDTFKGFSFVVATNSEMATGILAKDYVLRGVIAGVVLAVLVFAYATLRTNLFKGVAAGAATALGMLLTTAVIIITRLPVTASVIYVIAVSGLLTAVLAMVALNKIDETEKTEGLTAEEVVVNALATKEILTFAVLAAAALVVVGAVATAGVRWFAILALIALVVSAGVALVYVPAIYLPFKKKVDAKPVEGAYVGAEKTSTKIKKIFTKKKEEKKVAPVVEAPVEEVEETPAEEEVEETTEETEEAPAEEVEEATEETEEAPAEEVEETAEEVQD